VGVKYRYKTGETVSPWLPSEALREAAQTKRLTPESRIQQAGRDDWVLASSIPGLFQVAEMAPAAAAADSAAAREHEPTRSEHRSAARAPETIHHLLHRSVPAIVHLEGPSGRGDDEIRGMLIGVATDGIMVEVADCHSILYVPLSRIRFASIPSSFPNSGPVRKSEWIRLYLDEVPTLAHAESPASAS
jgi:hypothetical protein